MRSGSGTFGGERDKPNLTITWCLHSFILNAEIAYSPAMATAPHPRRATLMGIGALQLLPIALMAHLALGVSRGNAWAILRLWEAGSSMMAPFTSMAPSTLMFQ